MNVIIETNLPLDNGNKLFSYSSNRTQPLHTYVTTTMTPSRPKRSRWDTTTTTTTEPPTKQAKLTLNNDKLNRAQALKAKIAAQLTALKASNASKVTSSSSTRNHVVSSSMKKARVLELDFEKPDLNDIRTVKANQSSVVMLSDAADTATNMNMNEPNRSNYSKNHHVNKKNQEKGKFNPYLTSYKNSDDDDEDNNEVLLDNRIEKMEKIRRAHRPIHFVPQGVFIEKGERKRAKVCVRVCACVFMFFCTCLCL